VRALAVLGLALVLAGCGEGGRGHGTATLWVTRERGARVVYSGPVPSGLDAIQVVERRLKVTTRYGGRYLQSIGGVAGSLSAQRDWFYFVDGIEGDRSAAEVTVRPGAIVWWDYRHWTPATQEIPAVVGAYPQPFLGHGTTKVVATDRTVARALARQVRGVVGSTKLTRNRIVVSASLPPGAARIRPSGNGFTLELGQAIAARLAADPTVLRYRF
jgi:hypothetical protein